MYSSQLQLSNYVMLFRYCLLYLQSDSSVYNGVCKVINKLVL
jgi:hypothetical protein